MKDDELVPPLATWTVPGVDGQPGTLLLARPGEVTTIVGPNGSGKSALGLWLNANSHHRDTIRVIAHRRLWMQSASSNLSPAQRTENDDYYKSLRRQPESRYLDAEDARRSGVVLFDLLARENHVNSLLAKLVRAGTLDPIRLAQVEPSPIDELNAVLFDADLAIRLRATEEQELLAVNDRRGVEYPLNQASDGEKAALLLVAEILIAPQASIIIVDEPERHLHKSIAAGLVTSVIAKRSDCHFVVLTHDLELADRLLAGSGSGHALVDSSWVGGSAAGWSLFSLDAAAGVPEPVRRAILGGRRELLLVEGDVGSHDTLIYELLFPNRTLVAVGGGEQVARTVAGLRGSGDFHWIHAVGIVDGDGRDDAEKATLLERGVLALGLSEVENLYYMSVVMTDVAVQQAERFGGDSSILLTNAQAVALAALRKPTVMTHMAEVLTIAEMRRNVMESLPSGVALHNSDVGFTLSSPFQAIKARVDRLLGAGDFDALVKLLPIRDSGFRAAVAKALRFQSVMDYETFARVRLSRDPHLVALLRSEVGELPS